MGKVEGCKQEYKMQTQQQRKDVVI